MSVDVECRVCGEEFDTRCDACPVCEWAARFRAGMTAMARFMTWARIEAEARDICEGWMSSARTQALGYAIYEGRLALRWPDE